MLRILLGRARTGKSARVLEEIRALGDSSQQILLVPEHASHVAEVDVCRACGVTASRHAEVLTFKLLASRVLTLTGGAAEVTLDNGGKLLLLQRVLVSLAPSLRVYRRPSQRAAFLESLLALIEELQAYAVAPEVLAEKAEAIAGESGERLRDVALLYGAYLAKLHEGGRDARDRLEKLEENLAASGYADNKDIFLDGFSYFTGRERNILRILLKRAKSVTVTLLGDGSDSELFAEGLRVREQLYALARDAGVPCTEEVLRGGAPRDALGHVEKHFFGGNVRWDEPTEQLRLYEASTAYDEAERIAAEILRLVRCEGYRFRDITVTSRDMDAAEPVLRTVFARCGIPLYCARRSDILRRGVPALLLGVAFANLFMGLPIDGNGVYHGNIIKLLNPYGLAGGIFFVLIFCMHGALWLALKSEGDIHERAVGAAQVVWPLVLAVALLFLALTAFYTNLYANYAEHPTLLIFPILAVASLLTVRVMIWADNLLGAWFFSALFIITVTFFGVLGMYPGIIISSIDPAYSVTVFNGASSQLTLKIMLGVTLCCIPVVIAYQAWVYYTFAHKVTPESLQKDDHAY